MPDFTHAPELTFDQLQAWTRGKWELPRRGVAAVVPRHNAVIRGVSQDTREFPAGGLYVALRGQRDGHDFVLAAQNAGAVAAVVAEAWPCHEEITIPLLRVPDTLAALQDLARGWRAACAATTFVGVTGSAGKTTTRSFAQALLSSAGKTGGTFGNFNNDIGLPLSMLAMPGDTRFGVFEIGMNHPGELRPLCDILRPHAGIVTNVGPVHLEFFDSVEAIAVEKAELLRAIPADGFAALDADSPFFDYLKTQLRGACVSVSLGDNVGASWRGTTLATPQGGLRVEGVATPLVSRLAGRHNALNLFFAAALANRLGVSWEAMNAALDTLQLPGMRGEQLHVRGRWIVNDAYNANPMSMRCAIDTFAQQTADWKSRRVVVFGDMRELGDTSEALHRSLGEYVAKSGLRVDALVVVGAHAAWIAEAFCAAGGGAEVLRFADAATAAREVLDWTREGDAVLLKASRGVALERVADALAG